MQKPLKLFCACIGGLGLLILACSTYFTIVYGHGDFEAGNFHRCAYSVERDSNTGLVRRSYDTRWDLVSSTEGSALAGLLDMWFLGVALLALGIGIYFADPPNPGRSLIG